MKKYLLFLILMMPLVGFSQGKKLTLNGYVKDLFMYYRPEKKQAGMDMDQLNTNIIHNRLNLKWYASEKFTVVAEMRNRLMFGNIINEFPAYKNIIDVDNGYFDLSWISIDANDWFMHSMIDRAYFDYSNGKWQIRVGRQRINWGINLVWNPNDVFNSFSYFDFDYEERPGTDAVKIQYYTSETSSAELVYKPGHDSIHYSLAGLYRFAKWDYDFQFFTGVAGDDYIVGGGWSGDIKGAGFRGEVTYFKPKPGVKNPIEATVASVSVDYSFKNSIYIQAGTLYNSHGTTDNAGGRNPMFNNDLSAKDITQAKFSLFGQVSYPFTPLMSGNFSGIINPSDHSYYFGPAITYSLFENLELMLTGQLFFGDDGTEFGDVGQLAFARLRWSF